MEEINNYNVTFTLNFYDDLGSILKYVKFAYNDNFSQTLIDEFQKYISLLEIFPELFPESKYSHQGHTLRKIPVKGYVLFYYIDHDTNNVFMINAFNELENIDDKY